MDDEREDVKRILRDQGVDIRDEFGELAELKATILKFDDLPNFLENRTSGGRNPSADCPEYYGYSKPDVDPKESDSLNFLLGLRLTHTHRWSVWLDLKLSDTIVVRSPILNGATDHGRWPSASTNDVGPTTPKLKAANFHISDIAIGDWKRRYTCADELIAKVYFNQRKLVWEVLDGGLKYKMEIHWSDITAIKADIKPNQPGLLAIELGKQPLFFRERNPHSNKQVRWDETSDFTSGQASLHRRHYVQFPPREFDKHYENLMQCDQRLYELSQKSFPDDAYFNIPPVKVFTGGGQQTLQQPLQYANNMLAYPTESVASPQPALNPIMAACFITGFQDMEESPRSINVQQTAWRDDQMAYPNTVINTNSFETSIFNSRLSGFPHHNNYQQPSQPYGAMNVQQIQNAMNFDQVFNPNPNSCANQSAIHNNGRSVDQVLNHQNHVHQIQNPNPMISPNSYANHSGIHNNGLRIDQVVNQIQNIIPNPMNQNSFAGAMKVDYKAWLDPHIKGVAPPEPLTELELAALSSVLDGS